MTSRTYRIVCAGVALALLGLAVVIVARHAFDDDEFQHAHVAWLIGQGATPYVDFFEHHMPLYHLLLAPVFGAGRADGPWPLFVLRAISLLCGGAVLVLVYRLACRSGAGRWAALAAVWLLASVPMFALKVLEARPGAPAVCLLLGATALVLAVRCRGRALVAAGVLGGLAVQCSQKFVFAGLGLFVCVWLVHGFRAALLFACSAAASAVPLLGWLAARGALGEFYRHVLVMNVRWLHRFPPSGYLFEAFATAGPLVVLGVLGLVRAAAQRDRRAAGLAAVLTGGLAGLWVMPEPFRQAFLPVFPVLALGAARLIGDLIRSVGHDSPLLAPALAVFVAVSAWPGLVGLVEALAVTHAADVAAMHRLADLDPGGTHVFDGRGLVFYRRHVGRYACMHEGILMMLDAGRYAEHVIDALDRCGLPPVVRDYRVMKMPGPILAFLDEHYLPVGDGPIWTAGLKVDRARLTGAGAAIHVRAAGLYRATWAGGGVRLDGCPLVNGGQVDLTAGAHRVKADGFVGNLELRLIRRAAPPAPDR
ncbi:MAG: glycosyltransferase family 39 protein [Kiritimatiellae bacterium]|nr:glycosyltransferase family 39 protein [Kiritimatiellia bacterium]